MAPQPDRPGPQDPTDHVPARGENKLPLETEERIDKICLAYEDAWKAGERPSAERYLGGVAEGARAALLRELLRLETYYLRKLGRPLDLVQYHARFPAYPGVVVEVVGAVPARTDSGPQVFEAVTAQPPAGAESAGRSSERSPPRRFGPYEILEEIGRGGMGVVYRARQCSADRIVALKVIRRDRLASCGEGLGPDVLKRFRQEAQSAAKLPHEHIVTVYEVGEVCGEPFFSMRYVEGPSLAKLLWRGPISNRKAAAYLEPVARAVEEAHQHGILHRDLKPQNILVDLRTDKALVGDFGLAKWLGAAVRSTPIGEVIGSPPYMSPEQARDSSQVTAQTDVYALGATLYHALTGRPPFHAATGLETLRQVLHDEPMAPRRLNPAIDRDLETICLKCLEKDPDRRYSSARELADDLHRFLVREPVRARPLSPAARLGRWCRRRPLVAALIASVILALVAGTMISSYFAVRAKRFTLLAGQRAEEVTEKLWNTYLAQARAERRSGRPGQRFAGLEALQAAAAIRASNELRDEAIACMALTDVRVERQWACEHPGDPAVQFAPDLTCFAGNDGQGNIRVARVGGGDLVSQLPGHARREEDLLFSSDGRLLAHMDWAARSPECHVWDVARGTLVLSVPVAPGMNAMAFSPDDRSIAVVLATGAIRLYDTVTGKPLREIAEASGCDSLRFHPNRPWLAVVRRRAGRVTVLDLNKGFTVRELRHGDTISGVAWHPKGDLLAVPCTDFQVYVYAPGLDWRQTVLRGHQGEVVGAAFNHAGDVLATRSWDGTTRFWDPLSGEALLAASGDFRQFSPDDRHLAYWNYDVLGIWEVARPECRTFREVSAGRKGPWGVDFSPDGRWLASASDDGARVWDLRGGRPVMFLPLGVTRSAVFRPGVGENGLLCNSEKGLQFFPVTVDPQEGTPRPGACTTLHKPEGAVFSRACYRRDGEMLAAVTGTGGIVVWDLRRPEERVLSDTYAGAAFVAFSPDSKWLAVGAYRGAGGVKIFDLQESSPIADLLPESERTRVLFSPDGKWLVTSSDREYQFWEAGTWTPGRRIARDRPGLFGPAAFSPDGRLLAAASTRYAVRLIDMATGEPMAVLESPCPVHLSWLCFSPDGTQLAAASENHAIQVWDLRAIRARLAAMGLDWDL